MGEGDLQEGIQAGNERLRDEGFFHELPHRFEPGEHYRRLLDNRLDLDPDEPFQGNLGPLLREPLDLADPTEGADFVHGRHQLAGRLAAQLHQPDEVLVTAARLESRQVVIRDVQVEDHVREGDHVPQGEQWNDFRQFDGDEFRHYRVPGGGFGGNPLSKSSQ